MSDKDEDIYLVQPPKGATSITCDGETVEFKNGEPEFVSGKLALVVCGMGGHVVHDDDEKAAPVHDDEKHDDE